MISASTIRSSRTLFRGGGSERRRGLCPMLPGIQTPQTPGAYPRDERGVSGDWRVAPMDKTRYLPLAPPDLERPGYIEGLLDGHVRQEEADSGLPLSAAEEGSRCAEPAPERTKAREERGLLQKPPPKE